MRKLTAFKVALICLSLLGCKAIGANVFPTCYTACGDNREIILTKLDFVNTTKYKTRNPNKIHAFRIDFKVNSNLNFDDAAKNYGAVTFSLRVPLPDGKDSRNSVSASNLKDGLITSTANNYEYIMSISLSRDSHNNNYDQAMAIIEKCGGLPFEPTLARYMLGGLPSLVKFKPVFLKLSKEQIEIKPEEWDEYPLKKNFIAPLPADFNCIP